MQIKPNIAPHIAMGVFKDFLSRAYKIGTEKYLQNKIEFLIEIFTENWNNRSALTTITTEYLRNINKPKTNDQNNTKNTKNMIQLPWVPILGPKLGKGIRKKDIKTLFPSGANLKSILCQNRSKPLPNSYLGIYALNCSCNAEYIGETKKKVMIRTTEHQQGSIKGKWEKFRCHGTFFKMPWSFQLATPQDIIKRNKI